MGPLTNWDLQDSDFTPTTNFVRQIVSVHFGDSVKVEPCGYTFENPGICLELSGISSFNDEDISFLKDNILNFGANHVTVGYEMETGVITVEVFILKNASDNMATPQKCASKYCLCHKTINIVKSPYYRLLFTSAILLYRLFL